jgi:hypothetical protein
MADWILTLTFNEDGEIKAVTGPYGPGSQMDPVDRKKLKKSRYGLRPVDTLLEHDEKYEDSTMESTPKCYMIIGGYKVQVPCS